MYRRIRKLEGAAAIERYTRRVMNRIVHIIIPRINNEEGC